MKITDYFYLPFAAIALFLIRMIYPLSLGWGLLILVAVGTYQLYIFRRRLVLDFRRQEQTYQSKIEGTTKDMHLMESQIETVFNNIPSPLALMDTYGELVLFNQSFHRFLVIEKLQNLDYRSEFIDSGIRLFLKESYLTEKAIVRNVDFNGIDFQCLSVPINENNRYAGCLLVFQDITQAMEKERLQKRFIADASHELKTPIAAIKGMIEILNRSEFNDEEIMHDFHHQIQKETDRLEMIVSDLLQLSKLSSSQVLIQKSMTNLNQLIESCLHEIKKAESLEIALTLEGDLATVQLDEAKMHQVFINLLKNACMHSGAQHITVRVKDAKNEVEIRIKDDGCGINQNDLDHIFERFYRVDTHRARSSGGSGLGLAIVKSIVSAHQGEIRVLSEVGKGTEFIIGLPKE